jgi:hypothetical protein
MRDKKLLRAATRKAAAVFLGVLCFAAGAWAQDKPSIAVYPAILSPSVKNFPETSIDIQELTRRLEEALRATRRFSLFERDENVLQKWKLEGDIAESALAREYSTEFGKLNNVGLIVQPMIVGFDLSSKFAPVDGLAGMYRRIDAGALTVTSKVLSTTTGEIKYQITIEDGFSRGPEVVEGKSQTGVEPGDWISLATNAGVMSASSIVNAIFPIQVMLFKSNLLFLNRGEGGGLSVGDELQLFSAGEALIDPATKENLGVAEIPIGTVRIIQVNPKSSTATPVGDLLLEPKAGDIVRN